MNPTNIIIKYISEMDTEMLFDVLDENLTYSDAYKDVFIEKLEDEVFKKCRKEGDTLLVPHKGVCISKDCDNKGCKGISFIGNTSGITLDLILDDKNGEVQDIFYCRSLKTDVEETEYSKQIFFYLGTDELANFKPSNEYLANIQKADRAHEDISTYEDHCFNKEEILYLVEKYQDLYELTFDPFKGYRRFDKFNTAFEALKEVSRYINNEDQVLTALSSYNKQKMEVDAVLVNWLLKYEDLGLKLNPLICYMNESDINNVAVERMVFNNRSGFKIYKDEFENEIKFCQLFSEKYYGLLDRYKKKITDKQVVESINTGLELKLKDYLDLSIFGIDQ